MNMLDFILAASKQTITKNEFGLKMHDPDISEEEKLKILEEVVMAGGYDNLED